MRIDDVQIGQEYATNYGERVLVLDIVKVPAMDRWREHPTKKVRKVKVQVLDAETAAARYERTLSAVRLSKPWAAYAAECDARQSRVNVRAARAERLQVALKDVGVPTLVQSYNGITIRLSDDQAETLTAVLVRAAAAVAWKKP